MGFSKGAVAAVYSSNERFRKMYGPSNVEFAAHIGMYTPCSTTYRDDDKVSSKPIRLFHGQADDWVPIQPCRDYVERLKKAGADVALTEYPGATHAYDAFILKEPLKLPAAQTARNLCPCRRRRGTDSKQQDRRAVYLERSLHGATIAYDEAATTATVKAVKDLLTGLPAMAMKN
jgi:dienelactone hydrolase